MTERTALADLPTKLMRIADGALEFPDDEAVVRDAADALVRLNSLVNEAASLLEDSYPRQADRLRRAVT